MELTCRIGCPDCQNCSEVSGKYQHSTECCVLGGMIDSDIENLDGFDSDWTLFRHLSCLKRCKEIDPQYEITPDDLVKTYEDTEECNNWVIKEVPQVNEFGVKILDKCIEHSIEKNLGCSKVIDLLFFKNYPISKKTYFNCKKNKHITTRNFLRKHKMIFGKDIK